MSQNVENNYKIINKNDEWETPPEVFEPLNEEFNFELDVAATEQNAKCPRFFTREQDGLKQDWKANAVWCNPPYSQVSKWVKKAYEEVRKGNAKKVVMLVFAKTDTRWFHEYIYHKAEIRFIKGRVKFLLNGQKQKHAAPFPSMIVIWRYHYLDERECPKCGYVGWWHEFIDNINLPIVFYICPKCEHRW